MSQTAADSAVTAPSSSTHRRYRSGVIRRNRTINSCAACRTRRVKCDRKRPTCGRCAKEDKACLYVRGNTDNSLDLSPDGPLTKRRKSETCGRDVQLCSGDESRADQLERLALHSGGRSRYIGNTFWASFGDQTRDFNDVLATLPVFPFNPTCCCDKDGHGAASHSKPTGSNDQSQNSRFIDTILGELPPRDICDRLYNYYVQSIQPIIPLLHMPTFRSQYIRFWDWYDKWDRSEVADGILVDIPSFLCVLYAVLFAGCISSCNKPYECCLTETSRVALSSRLHKLTTHTLSFVSFPQSPTVYSLIAFLIAQNMLIREEEAMSSCSFISVALRVAQAMGMHRDGKHLQLDPIQAEMRRRIWWHIIHTDVMTSLSSGISPVITNDDLYDSEMISDLRDDLITSEPPSPRAARTAKSIDLGLYVTVGRYTITSVMRSLLRRQFEVRQPMKVQEIEMFKRKIDDINAQMMERIQKIDQLEFYDACKEPPLRTCPSQARLSAPMPKNPSSFRLWSQRLLKLMVHRAYCMLYMPLSRLPDGAISRRVRKDCITHCHIFIKVFIEMCTTQDFHPFYWIYPGVYQPLQATAMILADLIKHPNSEEARCSRILVERVFSLQGPNGVNASDGPNASRRLTNGGRDAWEMLKRLRKLAWTKAGLDPDVVISNLSPPPEPIQHHHFIPGQGQPQLVKREGAGGSDGDDSDSEPEPGDRPMLPPSAGSSATSGSTGMTLGLHTPLPFELPGSSSLPTGVPSIGIPVPAGSVVNPSMPVGIVSGPGLIPMSASDGTVVASTVPPVMPTMYPHPHPPPPPQSQPQSQPAMQSDLGLGLSLSDSLNLEIDFGSFPVYGFNGAPGPAGFGPGFGGPMGSSTVSFGPTPTSVGDGMPIAGDDMDWREWDLIVERYFNLPSMGQQF